VPVFSFGENDVSLCLYDPWDVPLMHEQIYEQMDNTRGTKVYEIQRKFQAVFGFTMPLFHGRGLLNCVYLAPVTLRS